MTALWDILYNLFTFKSFDNISKLLAGSKSVQSINKNTKTIIIVATTYRPHVVDFHYKKNNAIPLLVLTSLPNYSSKVLITNGKT